MIRMLLLLCSLSFGVTRTHQDLINLVGRKGDITHLYDLYRRASWVTPYEYGGMAGDTIDDTEAIQAAYDACKANVSLGTAEGGKKLFIPAGNWIIGKDSVGLLFDSPYVPVEGEGPTATKIIVKGSGTSAIKFTGGNGVGTARPFFCGIRDLAIVATSSVIWTNFLHLHNMSTFWMERVHVSGSTISVDNCVKLESALTLNIDKCDFRDAKLYTVDISKINPGVADGNAYPNSINISNTAIQRGTLFGIRYRDGELFKVSHCTIQANGSTADSASGGILITDAGQEVGQGPTAIITDTWFEANTGTHIRIGKHSHAPGGTIVQRCGGSGGAYGIFGSVATGQTGGAKIIDCGFVQHSVRDYYFSTGFATTFERSTGVTATYPATTIAIPTPTNSGNIKITASYMAAGVQTFTGGETTPEIQNGGPFISLGNGSATSITKLLNCSDGNIAVLYAANGNTTLKHRTSGGVATDEMDLPGNTDFAMQGGDVVALLRISGHWYTIFPQQNLRVGATPTFAGFTLSSGATISSGTGTPEAAVTAPVGSMFMRIDGGAGTSFYVKESGTGNTGWVGK